MSDYIVAHQEEFYRLAYSYVKNRDAALDVVQESIVKALAKSDTLRRPEYLKTWFYRILLNESMNHHRRAKRLVPLEDTLLETPVPARDPGERLDLYDAIERLDWKEQTVVRLRFFEDMKLDIEQYLESFPPEYLQDKQLLIMKYVERMSDYDIAAELDCDRSTVSKRIDRIIERINSQ